MKRTVRTISLTAALAVMIPLSAYAATSLSSGSETTAASQAPSAASAASTQGDWNLIHRMGIPQEVLDLLKLDQEAVGAKLTEGKTLAEIATEQGVSREALKQALTDANDKRIEERKMAFADNLDSMIDRPGGQFKDGMRRGAPGALIARDLSVAATTLGMTEDELKTALGDGKSLADLAKEKNVDVQKLIDAQKAAITDAVNEALKDGKLTQEQADQRLAKAEETAERIVNDTHPRHGMGGGPGRHGRGHGFGG